MGDIHFQLDEELETKLRIKIAKLGWKKGGLNQALVEAIEDWVKKNESG